MTEWFDNLGGWWLIAAMLLGGAELLVPGVFLVFLAFAAAVTGVFLLVFPELPVAAQLLSFAAWSVVAVLVGRRWYRDNPIDSSDPKLNDRIARLLSGELATSAVAVFRVVFYAALMFSYDWMLTLLGETVTVVQAIEGGTGRVRVGDGEWIARGPDTPTGTRVTVVGADGTTLKVAPLPPTVSLQSQTQGQ